MLRFKRFNSRRMRCKVYWYVGISIDFVVAMMVFMLFVMVCRWRIRWRGSCKRVSGDVLKTRWCVWPCDQHQKRNTPPSMLMVEVKVEGFEIPVRCRH